ncbi:MAG: multiheme c-type cytochrome [Myxococcota bacterium]
MPLLVLGGVIATGCGAGLDRPAHAAEGDPPAQPKRQALPRFEGPRLDGGNAGTSMFRGRRGIVYVFASEDRDADKVAGIVHRVEEDAAAANVAILGVSRDRDPQRGDLFARKHGFGFPIIRDVDLRVSRKLRLPPGESAVLVVDAEGHLAGGFSGLEGDFPDREPVFERELRRLLRLGGAHGLAPRLGLKPEAPEFNLVSFAGEEVKLSELRGKVVVLMFFSPTCPHCHEALKFLQRLSDDLEHSDLTILPVTILDRRYLIEDMLETEGLRFVVFRDPDGAARKAYRHQYSIPDTVIIDREGRVLSRHEGIDDRIQTILSMQLRQALGVKNVLLLDRQGYSGEEACRVCHAGQHETWALTSHAYAFDTLVEHGADRDPECVQCHTVGWDKPGGYRLEDPAPHLAGVQCENCHGRGGPHQSPQFLKEGFEPVCSGCHTPKHSLNFQFGERLPFVSHAANQQFTTLSAEERRQLLARRDRRTRTLFRSAPFVGSASCRECHASEYESWSRSAHASAFDTLHKRGEAENTDCQRCHTTGFEKGGGFPQGGAPLHDVGCESCHGPGGEHVEESSPKRGSILKLADKCDSCVMLQICGSCHDPENDPGFEFELLDKLEVIRHATAAAAEAL